MAITLTQLNTIVTGQLGGIVKFLGWIKSDGTQVVVNEDTPLPVTATFTLPTGASTSANQTTQITAEQAILAALNARLGVGAANLVPSQATSTGTAATLVIARSTRRSVLIRNTDTTNSIWVGPATVTTANGFLIKAGEAVPFTWVGLIQVIDNGSHATVCIADEYD